MFVENECIYTICLYICEFSYFKLKFRIKQSKIGRMFAEKWLPKAKISGPLDEKCTNLKLKFQDPLMKNALI